MTPVTFEGWIMLYNRVSYLCQMHHIKYTEYAKKGNPDDMKAQTHLLRKDDLEQLLSWMKQRIGTYYDVSH